MKGDLDAVTQWKDREIARVDAETAQAARWGAERFRKDLANLDTLDAQGRLNVASADGALPTRTPIAIPNEHMTAREAKAILDAQRGKVFVNQDDGREAKFGGNQINKMLGRKATDKSLANGFSMSQHNQAVARVGELYESATLIKERPDKDADPNIVAIRRYVSPIAFGEKEASAYITIKESEQNGNRIYSLEVLELEDPRLSIGGLTSDQHRHARESTDTVAYPGADVNPRREIGGLYSGAPVAYDRPSLKAVGSNTGSLAYGWGLYATTYKYAAMSYAQDALHEQVWWINRPEGDESHLLVWDEPISQENRERWLAAINSLGLDPRELAHFSYGEDWATHEMTGRQAYDFVEAIARYIIENAHPKQFASTLLARFDIDGMKYGNTYVAFSDEHLRVVRRWVWDPQTQDFDLDLTLPAPEPRRSIGGRAPRGVPLTAYHALSQEQLLRSLRQGGLVAPSIAVTEAGKARAFGYGECFLFFRREAVDPQANPENFIFPGDAGTPIYPRRWPTQTSVDAVLRRVRALGPEWTATTREEILREAMRVYNVTNESFEDSGLVDVPNALYALYLAESSDGDITPTPDGTRDIARDLAREDPDGFLRVPDFWRWAKAQFKISTRALTPRQATRLMRLAPLKELSSLSPELGDEMTQFHDSAMLALRDIEETRKVIVHPYNVERGFDALKRAIRKPGVSAENSLRHLSADLSLVNTEAELRDLFSRENEWYATGERALNALLRYIRNASGMEEGSYFEAKPMRLVGIDEIRMALIPQNASAELRTALTESGIPYKTYTEGDRRRAIRDAAAQTRFSIGGVAPSATSARQKDAHGAYPDLGGVIAAARFSVGAKRKQEYRDLIAKARPNLPQADVDAFMAEMDTLGDTKKEKAALHWFVKGALILPEETKTLGKALQVAEAFKIDPYRTDTPQEVLRIAATMAQDRSRELQGAFLRPEDIGLQLERDCGNGLKIYDVGETQQASVWRLMRSQGFIFVNPKTNKIIANSPWCLLTPTDSGSGPSQSAVAFWEGDPKATEEEINEDPYALGYTGIPKRAAFFRDRIVAFCADLNIDGYDRNRENWFDLNNDRVGQECEFFWEGTAEQMGLTHVPPETPVYVSGDESETEMTVGEEGSDVYEHYHDNELQESIVQPTLFPIAPFAKPRRQVGGNAPFNRADFVARATPIANDPNVKERSAHDFPIGDVPDALVRHGATPGGLLTTDGKIAKMARRHDLPPDRLADAIEAMNAPVAIFLEWEDAARGTIGLSVLTNILADDGEGRQAPVRLTLITRTDAPGMFLTSAYARKRSKEHNYVKVITNGGLLYVDEQRVAQLPLEDATVSACVPSNVRGDPSVGTVPNREEKVKENVRRAIGVESV